MISYIVVEAHYINYISVIMSFVAESGDVAESNKDNICLLRFRKVISGKYKNVIGSAALAAGFVDGN
jgi:hypothetical protein